MPAWADVRDVKAGRITMEEYRARYLGWLEVMAPQLQPGELDATGGSVLPVKDGDTLCCACSREAAAKGECHRVWAAEALVAAGWRVVLDGVEIPSAFQNGNNSEAA